MTKILFDGSKLSADVAGGVVNYIINLFKHFKTHESTHEIHSTIFLMDSQPKGAPTRAGAFTESIIQTRFKFFKSILFGLPQDYTVFHSPYMFLPPKRKGKVNILTVLDMINFERSFSVRNKFRELALRLAITRADFYICISEATKKKLQLYFPKIQDDQVLVTHLGLDELFLTASTSNQFEPFAQDPFLLYVGQRSDYKNFISLVEFMAHTEWKTRARVLCVGGGKFTKEELTLFSKYHLSDRIIHVGYSTTEDLKFLYSRAIALAYTSLAEGFGLPILEAMASGCPVICGNFSSMKEIAGGHAILVEDFSIESIGKALQTASSISRVQLDAAKKYAATFTWEKTALNTLALYKRLASSVR